ncbi:MAG: short-chain dehydrogenase, partial [Sphingopyxis granuli]
MSKEPQFDLTGRVALVTGASSGLGAGFARALAAA